MDFGFNGYPLAQISPLYGGVTVMKLMSLVEHKRISISSSQPLAAAKAMWKGKTAPSPNTADVGVLRNAAGWASPPNHLLCLQKQFWR